MAPLTWRDVRAPNFTGASSIMAEATAGWQDAFSGLNDAFQTAQTNRANRRSNEELARMAQVGTEAGVDPYLQNMNLSGSDMSPELVQAMMGLRGAAQGYDSVRGANFRQSDRYSRETRLQDQSAAMAPYMLDAYSTVANGHGGGGYDPSYYNGPTSGAPASGGGGAGGRNILGEVSQITGMDANAIGAVAGGESGGDWTQAELAGYSPERAAIVFGSRASGLSQAQLNDPEALFNHVYRTTNGNNQEGDGYRFRGRGLIQLTGRGNYERIRDLTGHDIVNNPDLMITNPDVARDVTAAYLMDRVQGEGSVENIRAAVAGGANTTGYNMNIQEDIARYAAAAAGGDGAGGGGAGGSSAVQPGAVVRPGDAPAPRPTGGSGATGPQPQGFQPGAVIGAEDIQRIASGQNASYVTYSNQGATRNDPISPELAQGMSFLADMGITMNVYSGGQEAAGEGGNRTGSVRHDRGGAADVRFNLPDGTRLNGQNPEHRPIITEIVRRARANGVEGWGHGSDYMGDEEFHVGFGNAAVWGAGGQGENTPSWFREAWEGGTSGPAPQGIGAPPGAGSMNEQHNPLAGLPPQIREMLAAEGNLIGASEVASMMGSLSDEYWRGNTGANDDRRADQEILQDQFTLADDIRQSSWDAQDRAETERDELLLEQAAQRGMDALRQSYSLAEAEQRIMDDDTLSMEARQAALETARSMGTESYFAPGPDATGVEGAAELDSIQTSYMNRLERELGGDAATRVYRRTQDQAWSDDPVLALRGAVPGLSQDDSEIFDMIQQVSRRGGINPAMAAAVIAESVQRNSFLDGIGFGNGARGDLRADRDRALSILGSVNTPSAQRAAEANVARLSESELAFEELRRQGAEIARQNDLDRRRGFDSGLEARQGEEEQFTDAVRAFERDYPIYATPGNSGAVSPDFDSGAANQALQEAASRGVTLENSFSQRDRVQVPTDGPALPPRREGGMPHYGMLDAQTWLRRANTPEEAMRALGTAQDYVMQVPELRETLLNPNIPDADKRAILTDAVERIAYDDRIGNRDRSRLVAGLVLMLEQGNSTRS